MKKAVRKAIIAGNWKMNKTRPEAKELLEAIKPLVANAEGKVEVIACVPFTNLETAINATAGSNVKIGAENVHFEKSGAFTGEISADMLVELGVEYVVIGHSERRQYFGETDETVNKRTKAALAAGLKPIVCVGELLWERECNITEEVIARQVKLDFFGVSAEDVKKSVTPEAQRVITENLGSFDDYLIKCIEDAVRKVKQEDPYITLDRELLESGSVVTE